MCAAKILIFRLKKIFTLNLERGWGKRVAAATPAAVLRNRNDSE